MTNTNQPLGFIGIGLMGEPMTLRLLAAGYRVNVWNRTTEKLQAVTQAGAIPCASIADLVAQSDIILLCLADTPIVENIVKQQILPQGNQHKLLIDLSSTYPETTRRLAQLLPKSCKHYTQ